MRKTLRKIASVLLLCALFASSLPLSVSSQSASELRQQINDHNAQIEALNREIAQYEAELEVIGGQRQTLENTVASLDIQRRKISASISATQNRIGALQLEIQALEDGILLAEDEIQVNEAGLAESIRRLNESETQSLVLHVLSSDNLAAVWDDMEIIRQLQDVMQADIQTLSVQKISLSETKEETEIKQGELVTQRRKLVSEQGSLDATRRAQNELLAQTRSQESNYQALLDEKQTAKAAFEAALQELESKLEFTLDPSRIPPAGKGILRWPLDKIFITQEFGRTSSSGRLYASGTHNGVDFRATIGTPLKAALSGTVVGTGNTDGGGCYSYGKWILIRHGNGLSTLYAHLSEIGVSEGQSVSTGQLIGYTGFTGYATGPHLHFSVFASDGVQVKNLGAWYRENGLAATTACARQGVSIPVAARSAYLDPLDYL